MSNEHVALVTRDAQLVTDVRRLAAVAGQQVLVATDPIECVKAGRAAALAIVDAQAVDAIDDLGALPAEVVVVTDDASRISCWEAAVRLGARRVLTMPAQSGELLDVLALAGERPGPAGPLIGVIGGSGGVGASTLAVALGWAFARTRPFTVVDLDPCAGGLDVLLGLERAGGLRWPDLHEARGVVASSALRTQLPAAGQLAVVSGRRDMGEQHSAPAPLNRQAITSIVDAMRRGGDVVVADLPRAIDDAVAGVIATCDVVLLVTPADVRGVSAAMHVRRRLQVSGGTARVVVRAEPRARLHVKDVVTALGLEHAGTLRTEKGVTAAIDRAQFIPWLRRSGLGRTACSIADDLSETSLRGVA